VVRFDYAGMYDRSLQLRQWLSDGEEVFYSLRLEKYTRWGFCQDRIVVVTQEHLYVLSEGDLNYTLHRKLELNKIEAFTQSTVAGIYELVIHVKNSFDEHYICPD